MSNMYIVMNADYDGYNQQFQVLPADKVEEGDWEYLLREWGLNEGDIIYKCEKVATVEKQLVIKQKEE